MVCARVFFVLVRGKRRSSILFINIISSHKSANYSLVVSRTDPPSHRVSIVVCLLESTSDVVPEKLYTAVGSHARTHTFLSPRRSRRLPTVARPSDGLAVMARRTNIVTTHLFVGPVSGGRKLTGVYPLPPTVTSPRPLPSSPVTFCTPSDVHGSRHVYTHCGRRNDLIRCTSRTEDR